MGVTQEVHEAGVKSPSLTDNLQSGHQTECLQMAEVFTKMGEQLKAAKTYKDIKDAIHLGAIASAAIGDTDLLDIVNPNGDADEVTIEEVYAYQHSGPTDAEGTE